VSITIILLKVFIKELWVFSKWKICLNSCKKGN